MPDSPAVLSPPDEEKGSCSGTNQSPDDSEERGAEEKGEAVAPDGPDPDDGGLSAVVSRVLSRSSVSNPGPPPDGGTKAWVAVACAHLVVMNTWGVVTSFGVFQSYYVDFLGRPPSDISWIGSLQIFLLFFIGTLTGRLTDAGFFRHVFWLGAAFQVLGIFAAASAKSYWQLLLAQGVCLGLGNGCLFCPTVTVISTYFSRRRNFAIGLVASGSATGGLVFPSMARQLLPAAGFPWAMRAIGFVQLATLAVACLFLQPRGLARKAGPLVEWAAFKELDYSLFAVGSFFCYLGLYFAFFYLTPFSRDVMGLSYSEGLNLLLVLNGVGLPGRLGPNLAADRWGPVTVLVPCALAAGLCLAAWPAMQPGKSGSTAGLYVWAVVYGTVGGAIQSLFPAGSSSLTPDLRRAGVRIGMLFTLISFAVLAGPPIAGALISAAGGRYYGAQAFAAASVLLGTALLVGARIVKGRMLGGGWSEKV